MSSKALGFVDVGRSLSSIRKTGTPEGTLCVYELVENGDLDPMAPI